MEWKGTEWNGTERNNYSIPLFRYSMMERNKLFIPLFGKWTELIKL